MATKWHSTCPGCGKPESTECVAVLLLRFEGINDELPSHRYAICPDCLEKQREQVAKGNTWTLSKIPLDAI